MNSKPIRTRSKPDGFGPLGRDPRNSPLQSQSTFIRRVAAFLSAFLFVSFLVLPTANTFLVFAPKAVVAESDVGDLPRLTVDPASWSKWFTVMRRGYLERHFGLRNLLITWNSLMDTFVLASTAPSSQVLVGKDNWLFLAQDGGRNIIEDFRSPQGLPEEATAAVVGELERRRQWLAKRGIRYLVILAPNKNTVYPDKLPDALRPQAAQAHFQQFVRYARTHSQVEIVDVTPALLEAKKTRQVFYVTDSHWNANGAFAAYQDIIKPLARDFPAIVPLVRQQFTEEYYSGLPGDLSFMMGLADHLKEDRLLYVNKDWYKARGASYDGSMDPHYFETPQYSLTGNPSLPNAVVFHDSFWWELLPFVAESFNKALYVWLKPQTETEFRFFDAALIERMKPDIVIDEFTERYIVPPLNGRFKPRTDAAAAKQ